MTRPCATCHRHRPHHAGGQCGPCYRQPYQPRTGNPGGAGVPKTRDDIASRLEDLALLMREETHPVTIARRLGVSTRTVRRYVILLERSA